MLRLATDEDFNYVIVRGLRHRDPALDSLRVQEARLSGSDDLEVLAWAADGGRVLLTHDVNTLVGFAYDRIVAGLSMPGVFAVPKYFPVAQAVEEILLLARCSHPGEWEGQVRYFPLR